MLYHGTAATAHHVDPIYVHKFTRLFDVSAIYTDTFFIVLPRMKLSVAQSGSSFQPWTEFNGQIVSPKRQRLHVLL